MRRDEERKDEMKIQQLQRGENQSPDCDESYRAQGILEHRRSVVRVRRRVSGIVRFQDLIRV